MSNTFNDEIFTTDFAKNPTAEALQKRFETYWFGACEKLIDGQKNIKFNFPLNILNFTILKNLLQYKMGRVQIKKEDYLSVPFMTADILSFKGATAFKGKGLDNLPSLYESNALNPIIFFEELKKFAYKYFDELKTNIVLQDNMKFLVNKLYN
jgi:hypothetical protein